MDGRFWGNSRSFQALEIERWNLYYYMARCMEIRIEKTDFEWDDTKNAVNQAKHGVSFADAQRAFTDCRRVIARDLEHSETEERFYCFGEVDGNVMTIRFTYRRGVIRIIGAGYWRKGKAIYEQQNQIHR
jgi:uncharacterized protein